jgi:hypothetical protein
MLIEASVFGADSDQLVAEVRGGYALALRGQNIYLPQLAMISSGL